MGFLEAGVIEIAAPEIRPGIVAKSKSAEWKSLAELVEILTRHTCSHEFQIHE
jgi:hypothetical protein